MKKCYLLLLWITAIGYSQVGINTTMPDALLDIKSSNQATPANTDGILIPKIDAFPATNPTAAQNSMLVYLTTTSGTNQPGFYYWDNATTTWKGLGGSIGWGLTGNAGTNATSNFIGTTDDKDIVFKRNNIKAGLINSASNNTALGVSTLNANTTGSENTAIGKDALTANTWGSYNTAIGYQTLTSNTTGDANVALGINALKSNTIGKYNIALGNNALTNNLKGEYNIALGISALPNNTNASRNIAIGYSALFGQNFSNGAIEFDTENIAIGSSALRNNNPTNGANAKWNLAVGNNALSRNNTGIENTAVGYYSQGGAFGYTNDSNNNTSIGCKSLANNGSGNFNTAVGSYSLFSQNFGNGGVSYDTNNVAVGVSALYYNNPTATTNGINNTAIGNFASNQNTTGLNNTALGYGSLYRNTTGSSNVALGYLAGYYESGSNKLYIENSNSTAPLIYGEFDNDIVKVNGTIKVNLTAADSEEMQVKNTNIYSHANGFQNFGNGGNSFTISSRDDMTESGGIHGDGNAITLWAPGDSRQGQTAALVYFIDEDWFDATTNAYDNNALKSYITPAGNYVQISDKNKKENIVKLTNAIDKISQINGYTYQFKLAPSEIEKGDKPIKSSGVIAQEIEKVLPEAVQKNDNGDYFVDYAAITPLLIEAIKEQNDKIQLLENRLKMIEDKLGK